MNRKIFACVILLIGSFALTARTAQAQLDPPGEPKYKPGDRVEFDKLMAGDPSRAEWVKATVVRIDVQTLGGGSLKQTSYVIKTDTGYQTSVTRRHAEGDPYWKSAGWFRPTADAGPPPNADQPNNPPPGPPNGPPAPDNTAAGGKYKKGDCVDFDILKTGDATRAEWKPGKIVDVQIVKLSSTQTQTNYVVQLDQPGLNGLPQKTTVSQRLAEQGMTYAGDPNRLTGFFRPRACDGAGPQIETATAHRDQNGNIIADRPLLDCNSLATAGRNGQRPDPELMKKVIRCIWEDPGKPGFAPPIKVDITEFAQGGTRGWDGYNDAGTGGSIDTVFYHFRVTYNKTTFEREYTETETGHVGLFKCWVAANKWQCSEDNPIKWGEVKRIAVTN